MIFKNDFLNDFLNDFKKNIPCLGQVQTLSSTGSHEIVYPVQGREAKNHTLSSGTSPYRPYKGVSPRDSRLYEQTSGYIYFLAQFPINLSNFTVMVFLLVKDHKATSTYQNS